MLLTMVSNHSYIPVFESTESLETNGLSKEKLTTCMKAAITKVQNAALQQNNDDPLPQDLPEVWRLCECLDKALLHGLKQLQYGYWSCVREFTHPNCRLQLEGLTHIQSGLGRGRAWLCQALNESTLESFFGSFLKNPKILGRYYTKPALLRDSQQMQVVITLMAGLEFVTFNMPVDAAYLDSRGFSYFLSMSDQDSETDTLSASSSGIESKSQSATPVSMQSLADEDTEPMSIECGVELSDDSVILDLECPSPECPCTQCNIIYPTTTSVFTKQDHVDYLISLDADVSDHECSSVEVIRAKVCRRRKKLSSSASFVGDTLDNENGSELDSVLPELACDIYIEDNTCSKQDVQSSNEIDLLDTCSTNPTDFINERELCEDQDDNYFIGIDDLGERGTPEGQEDPIVSDILSYAVNNTSTDVLAKSLEEVSIYDNHTLKGSPVHQIPEQISTKIGSPTRSQLTSQLSICSNETCTSLLISQDELVTEIPDESLIQDGSIRVDENISLYLTLEVFQQEEEYLYKVFLASIRRWNGQLEPVFVAISDKSLYILSEGNHVDRKIKTRFWLSFSELDQIMVYLNYHSFLVCGKSKKDCFKVFTGSNFTTRSILSNLDVRMRRSGCKMLPSVVTWPGKHLHHLQKLISTELRKKAEEVELQYFACVQWENYLGLSPSSTPGGPTKEGFLMYKSKVCGSLGWNAAYFHLKAGVLYCYKEQDAVTPNFYFQLHYPHFQGCQRLNSSSHRPHSFELRLHGNEKLQLAAPNDYEASSWQQAIMQMLALFGHLTDGDSRQTKSCSLVLADHRFFMIDELREDHENAVQASASLADLSAVCVDQECSNCFVLEFESGEANSCGGEWILIFADSEEKENFLDTICSLWENLFQIPLQITSVKDLSIWSRCREHYQNQKSTREHLESLFSSS